MSQLFELCWCLYYLQGFSEPQLDLKNQFSQFWNNCKSKPTVLRLAEYLPYCDSESEFKQEIERTSPNWIYLIQFHQWLLLF